MSDDASPRRGIGTHLAPGSGLRTAAAMLASLICTVLASLPTVGMVMLAFHLAAAYGTWTLWLTVPGTLAAFALGCVASFRAFVLSIESVAG